MNSFGAIKASINENCEPPWHRIDDTFDYKCHDCRIAVVEAAAEKTKAEKARAEAARAAMKY